MDVLPRGKIRGDQPVGAATIAAQPYNIVPRTALHSGGWWCCWHVGSGMVAVVMEVAIATVMVVTVLATVGGGGGDGSKRCGLYVNRGCFGICNRHNLHLQSQICI